MSSLLLQTHFEIGNNNQVVLTASDPLDFCLCTTTAERSNKMSTTPTMTRVAALSFAGPFFRLLCCNNASGFIRGIFSAQLQTNKSFPPLPHSNLLIAIFQPSTLNEKSVLAAWKQRPYSSVYTDVEEFKRHCFESKGVLNSEPRVLSFILGFATEYGASEAESWQHN